MCKKIKKNENVKEIFKIITSLLIQILFFYEYFRIWTK